MPQAIENLRTLIALNERGIVPDRRLLRAAARELFAILANPRGLKTIDRGIAIRQLRAQKISASDICAKLGISPRQYERALEKTAADR